MSDNFKLFRFHPYKEPRNEEQVRRLADRKREGAVREADDDLHEDDHGETDCSICVPRGE